MIVKNKLDQLLICTVMIQWRFNVILIIVGAMAVAYNGPMGI